MPGKTLMKKQTLKKKIILLNKIAVACSADT